MATPALGTSTNQPEIDAGTNCRTASPVPGALCIAKSDAAKLPAETRKLAAIAYGEASGANDASEIGGIAFTVANRARAWGGKTIEQLLSADPNYTYAVKDGNARYAKLMRATEAAIQADAGMKLAVAQATAALAGTGTDPSNGAFWWDGLDFKTNYKRHPKVADGFRWGSKDHNIFGVEETSRLRIEHWRVKNKKGQVVDGAERGRYSVIWVSTAAAGKTIFWTHDADYLKANGIKAYQ